MSETLQMMFEIIGTVAFSVSGAMVGVSKKMDIFGVAILGITAAVGGGVIRDIILGLNPPVIFTDPTYALIASATSIIVFLPSVRNLLKENPVYYERALFLMDSIGLGIFTVVGIQTSYSVEGEHSIFLLTFVGVVTGVGGGILRDMLAGDRPYIFVKHFYACASIIGALVCSIMWLEFGQAISMMSGTAIIIALRICAAKFRWSLPRA